jgi:2-polyprenyl-3-methyl-5-hydroxy-6-metoxy-1,4-benzoquinol methylase
MSQYLPSLDDQRAFWDGWNREWRAGGLDDFMAAQRDVAVGIASALPRQPAAILEAGCGTGWLSNELSSVGHVIGVDLSSEAIASGQERFPGIDLRCADFLTLGLDSGFDMVVSADAIAHVYDPAKYIDRIAGLLKPGGAFLLMTQNPFVWHRRSRYRSYGGGQIEQWPGLRRLRALLRPCFTIEKVTSIVPGGDRGLLFWVENRYVRGGMRQILGDRWQHLLERLLIGRELVVVAKRR